VERQAKLIADAGRPAGYVNLAVERDWVVRFKAQPGIDPAYPKSFGRLLAEAAGYRSDETRRRIAWLLEPRDGSDTFLTIPAQVLLRPAGDAVAEKARAGLRDKIVIVGGMFPDFDRHVTPLSTRLAEMQSGAAIHAHMTAEFVDGRSIVQLEADSWALRLELAAVAALAFLIGWRTRHQNQGLLIGSFATAAIIAVDTFVFWQWRIILPIVLALMAWFLGEFTGHYIGRWLGHADRSRWFVR
jgi:CHASE2 domain-containing sensor protein